MISFLVSDLFIASLCIAQSAPSFPDHPDSPNIVLILTDDMGYTDLSCYGQTRWSTPRLDSLAQSGIRFTRAYASASVCTPSRCGLLTGCYPFRSGLGGHALWFNAQNGLSPKTSTLPSVLKSAGYQTACFGKWHLGHLPKYAPNLHGFDVFEGIPYSHSMWTLRDDGSKVKFPPLPLFHDSVVVDHIDTQDKMEHLTERFTDGACRFIEQAAEKKRPFFVYLAHPMPHVPLGCTAPFRGKSGGGLYGDVMMELDANVGRVIDTLDRLRVRDNTIFIFTSDNGPWLNYGNHGGTCDGLREGKGTSFEGGFRVPMLVSFPAGLKSGKVEKGMVSHLDLFPTLLAYAGVSLSDLKTDGFDMRSFWQGTTLNPRHEFSYYFNRQRQAQSIGNLKEIFPHDYESYELGRPGKDGKAETRVKTRAQHAVYDLEQDLGETHDIQK